MNFATSQMQTQKSRLLYGFSKSFFGLRRMNHTFKCAKINRDLIKSIIESLNILTNPCASYINSDIIAASDKSTRCAEGQIPAFYLNSQLNDAQLSIFYRDLMWFSTVTNCWDPSHSLLHSDFMTCSLGVAGAAHVQHTLRNSGFMCSPVIKLRSFKLSSAPTAAAAIWAARHGALPMRWNEIWEFSSIFYCNDQFSCLVELTWQVIEIHFFL